MGWEGLVGGGGVGGWGCLCVVVEGHSLLGVVHPHQKILSSTPPPPPPFPAWDPILLLLGSEGLLMLRFQSW